ncbi:MAG: RagB/SusD family nutrient uptake outer membrane protein [Tannerella sp.]|nr:RagB/SusD family nutrient uptake outer membrane protein [Tannerella sp.]
MNNIIYKVHKKYRTLKIGVWTGFLLLSFSACDYLDVVPEGISSLDNAFTMRTTARRFLYTCYSFQISYFEGPELTGGDEVWLLSDIQFPQISLDGARYAEGLQTAQNSLFNYWSRYYRVLRDCNVFLENVGKVPDLPEWERDQWIAEVKVLKAYHHFLLLQQYGPVPIIRENLPISAGVDEVRVMRDKADDVANYAVELIDEALPNLPNEVYSPITEKGRITLPIALMIKAMIRITIASPLFNSDNELFSSLRNHDSNRTQLISSKYSVEKWKQAEEACKEAVEVCEALGFELYEYPGHQQYDLTPVIKRQMSLRLAFNERWNKELIWGDTKEAVSSMQVQWTPKLDLRYMDYPPMKQYGGPPLKIVEQFYSNNGVPINEDKFWNYSERYDLQTATAADRLLVKEGSVTAKLNFNREPRFYAWLGFDNGIWYGQGNFDDTKNDLFYVQAKAGQANSIASQGGSSTGYYVKKWINSESVQTAAMEYTPTWYIWPNYRLTDLYLLYAEALNEAEDSEANRDQAIFYLDKVRTRAGLQGVKTSWDNYSTRPDKYTTQSGLQEIIRQERMIELCFERKRFWDIRRWMTISDLYQIPIQGWKVSQRDAADYYQPTTIFQQEFRLRDYFWPIPEQEVLSNPNLVQNIGW